MDGLQQQVLSFITDADAGGGGVIVIVHCHCLSRFVIGKIFSQFFSNSILSHELHSISQSASIQRHHVRMRNERKIVPII